ncbi:hemolysin III family protein [Arenibacter sp. S6351L]|uniref:PAQR family membrane homeostasis protein TrhA n=1 Tax=Arenibacter sp. S6351L TaxID=2926407 RepID=UPI001FF5C314|nr:hemolysin III family protein [Arenibacter sp. S6351L]MCK0135487.1 hemolysin III family protein [Arenibacter sp. S6351L]|tara:strand:+ start:928 stop:1566 length:639 start_codon:yes stop_codon:yes gene_type:complete
MQTPETETQIKQELVNSIIHGFGIIFGITGIPILIAFAIKSDNTPGVIGAAIYGFCFMQLFTFSTLYHGFQHARTKRVLEILDHISIYFLISGTYTPFLLVYMNNSFGITLLSVLWSLTALGIVFKIYFTGKWKVISTLVYTAMGCIMVVGGRTFFETIPVSVMTMIFIGGTLYLMGIIFYLWEKYPYNHAVWHFFVLAAAVCHYVAILLAV